MTETVWVVANPSGGHQGRMHTNEDCVRLKGATKPVLEKERNVVESHRPMCKWCSGEADPGGSSGDPAATKNLLLDTDPDEVFG